MTEEIRTFLADNPIENIETFLIVKIFSGWTGENMMKIS